jgi:hypothetical protein
VKIVHADSRLFFFVDLNIIWYNQTKAAYSQLSETETPDVEISIEHLLFNQAKARIHSE